MPLNYKLPTNGNMPNVSMPNKKEVVQKKDISFEAQTPKYAIEDVVLNENILSEIQNILSFSKYKNLLTGICICDKCSNRRQSCNWMYNSKYFKG